MAAKKRKKKVQGARGPAAGDVSVKVDAGVKREYDELVAVIMDARDKGAKLFDVLWEAAGKIVEKKLFFVGGHATAKEFYLKVCGEDHVGIGSDVPFFRMGETDLEEMKKAAEKRKADGIAAPGEDRPTYIPDLNTPRKIEFIADALLKRGHKPGAIEKIVGLNFKRVFGEIWTT